MCTIGIAQLFKGVSDYNKSKKDNQKQVNAIKQPLIEAQELDKKASQYQENNKVMKVPTKVQTPVNSSTTNQQRQLGLNLGA